MESVSSWIEQNVGHKLRVEPLNEIHLPSFVLGCSVMITISLLGPFMKMFVGGILLTVVTLVKYIVIIGGITACIVILTTKNKVPEKGPPAVPLQENAGVTQRARKVINQSIESDDGTGLGKDNFEQIKYYDIPKTKLDTTKFPTDNAYDKFINRAAFKDSCKDD